MIHYAHHPSPALPALGGRLPPGAAAGAGLHGVAALLVSAEQGLPPRELARRGMAGLGCAVPRGLGDTSFLDSITGGKVSEINAQLDAVTLLLKVSAGAALFAGLASLLNLIAERR